jgi:TolB protein
MMQAIRLPLTSVCVAAALTLTLSGHQPFDAAPSGVEGQQQQQQPQQPPPTQPPQQPAELQLKLSGTGGAPPKIAVAGFIPLSTDAETVAAAKTLGDVLYDDLNYEREYYLIAKDAVATVPKPTSIDDVPLDGWKQLNADGVIVGSLQKTGNGVLVKVKLIQVSSGRMAFGKEYSGSIANPRQYAHTISDEIFQQQMQLRGVARTKLAFSSDRDLGRIKGPVGDRETQEIYFSDYDGANQRRLTVTKTLNLAPSWSPDGQSIAYTSWPTDPKGSVYEDIIVSFIYRGMREMPAHGSPHNQNYLPAWSPDGSKLAFVSNRDGNPEIYVMNRDGSGVRRITTSPAIDEAPTWSPSGNQIAWVSDRSATPHIYVMNADGTGQRLLIGNGYCDRPTWSAAPFNEIAYSCRTGPGFDVFIYSFQTGESHRLTDGIGTNESPVFSPNGRHVAFVSTRSGKSQIFTIDRDGNDLRQITREGNNKYPSWSQ